MNDIQKKFRQFMNIHWLRPEAGFFKTYDYTILKDLLPLPEPSIDLCCGDGVTSYIWAGGEFNLAFDMYQSVRDTDIMFDQNADVFDSYNEQVKPIILKKPAWHFTCGLDLKLSLLRKAEKLQFYERLINHDLTSPMPFHEGEFNSAFSTTLWVNDTHEESYRFIIREVNTILQQGGTLVFRVHETKFKNMMFHNLYEQYGFRWAKRLNRFLYQTNPPDHIDIQWWVACLEQNGFEIRNIHNYVPRLVMFFYLIGFRPMFNSFMMMYNMLTPSDRVKLKKQWIQDLEELFEEFMFEENVKRIDPAGENILYMIEATKVRNL